MRISDWSSDVCSSDLQVKSEAEMRGEMADAKAFLNSLSGTEKSAERRESLTVSGLPMETQGKTFGALFPESEAYTEFVGRYATNRSEERRVGRECVSPCGYRW